MIQAIADTVIGSAEELTELDRAIGDADHGVNLERGFKAVLTKIDAISARPINDALADQFRIPTTIQSAPKSTRKPRRITGGDDLPEAT